MKVFISWSGDTGRALAEILHQWLPSVIQAVKPYFSPNNVAKGARWSIEISNELETSQVGLIVVTPDSLDAPWLMFEAGALSKNIGRARVSPILFNLEPTDVGGPLAQFQAAKFDRTEIKRVMRMINGELGDLALADNVLNTAFDIWWPRLEQAVTGELSKKGSQGKKTLRPERELLEEALSLIRSLAQRRAGEMVSKESETHDRMGIFGATKIRDVRLSRKEIKSRLGAGGNLTGANMVGINLSGMDLSGANLRGANLVGANLTNAKLTDTNLKAANLERAVLVGADVLGADMSYVNLWCARMDDVRNLKLSNSMEHANFFGVEGLGEEERRFILERGTLEVSNYPDFFLFFHKKQGMSKAEISELFIWTAHPDFTSYITMLPDT